MLYWLKEWKYVWRGREGRTKWGDVEETKAAHCSWQLITTNCSESTRASVSIILYSRLTVSVIPGSRPQSADPPPSEEGSWTHWREKTQQQQQLITPAHHSQRAAISCLRWSGKNFEGLKTGTLAYLSSLSSDVWLSLLNVDISRYLPNKMWKSPRCNRVSLNVRGRQKGTYRMSVVQVAPPSNPLRYNTMVVLLKAAAAAVSSLVKSVAAHPANRCMRENNSSTAWGKNKHENQ